MDPAILYGLLFTGGISFEAFRVLAGKLRKEDRGKILLLSLTMLFAVIWIALEEWLERGFTSEMLAFVWTVVLVYFFLLVALCKKRVLPQIDETNLLILNAAIVGLIWMQWGLNSAPMWIVIPGSLLTLAVNLTPKKVPKYLSVLLYVWFATLFIVMLVYQLQSEFINLVRYGDPTMTFSLVTPLAMGMVTFYLITNAVVLFEFMPESKAVFKDHCQVLSQKYAHHQTKPMMTSVIIALIAGAFWFNLEHQWLSTVQATALIIFFLNGLTHWNGFKTLS